ncbi:MAG: hypothetical protein CL693_08320 [Cellvibrionaceae bacterium]|nr:hypothetical protein [Cellvibrionaceae bacterium]
MNSEASFADQWRQSHCFRYNAQGQPTLVTDALGNHWQKCYNAEGLLAESRAPNNNC